MILIRLKKKVTFNGNDFNLTIEHVDNEIKVKISDVFEIFTLNESILDIARGINKENFDNNGYIWVAESVFNEYKNILDKENEQKKKNHEKQNVFNSWDGSINIGYDGGF